MATRDKFLPYYIVLSDAARVAELQAQYPRGINQAIHNPAPPATATGGAVIAFNAPFVGYNERIALETTGDHIWTPWYKDGSAGDKPFPIDVATFTRKTGGFLGLGGTTTHYYWIGQFVYGAPAASPPNVDPDTGTGTVPALVNAPLAQRRWIDGFEMRNAESRASNSRKVGYSAGRRAGGKGLKLFVENSDSTTVATTLFGGSAAPGGVWTRFRMRWSRAGFGTYTFARWTSTAGVNCHFALSISPTGDVILTTGDDNSLTTAVQGTLFTATLGEWFSIDAIPEFNPAAGLAPTVPPGSRGRFRFYVNRTNVYDEVFPDEGIAGGNAGPGRRLHFYSGFQYGNVLSASTVLAQVDIDDLVECSIPVGKSDPEEFLSSADYIIGDEVLGSDDHVYRCKLACGASSTVIDPAGHASRATYWDLYEGLDWLNGSALVRCRVKAFGSGNAWSGDYRSANQPAFIPTNRGVITSSTSGAICEVEFDIDRVVDTMKGNIGIASALFGVHAFAGAAENGAIAYDIGAGAAGSTVAALQNGTGATFQTMYRPAALATPDTGIATMKGLFTHAASVVLESIFSFYAVVEVIGVFGQEDLRVAAYPDGLPTVQDGNALGQHNAPYASTPWSWGSTAAAPGPAGVAIVGGTYVGNGTGQDVTFRMPVHMFWVRPTTGVRQGGGKWFSTMHYGHQDDNQGVTAMHACNAEEDPSFVAGDGEDVQQNQYLMRIAGGNQQSNALGVTYQYIAFCDPGGRFVMNHMVQGNQSSIGQDDLAIELPNADFVPEWLWAFMEDETTAAGNAIFYKSLGHAAATIGEIGTTAAASAVTFGTGSLRIQQAFYTLQSGNTADNIALSCWRRSDGNDDPNESKLMTFGSYTGDGVASKSLTVGVNGLRPLFVCVIGDNGNGNMRDPSHTTTDSELLNGGGASATGITAGALDGFTVGSLLNVNAVLYHYFVLWGSATAGNNGWSINGEFTPVEAAAPADGIWPDDPDPSIYDEDEEEEPGGGGDVLSLDADLDTTEDILTDADDIGGLIGGSPCETYTRELINIALSHLEISKEVGNLATELSEIAALARRHVKSDINTVLRSFPWDFATRYADLVLVAGTATVPVNNDWQYSYRAPNSMVTARRIAKVSTSRKFDPQPVTFRLGQDASGLLIYCNELATATVPLVLEYTYRNECPAFWGDPLFREALSWKFAASLSPLARDGKKKEFCLQMFRLIVSKGETADANEQQQEPPGEPDWISGRQ